MQAGDDYSALRAVLDRALEQAASGKGKERHARPGLRFEDQPIVTEGTTLGGIGFQVGQARKKLQEATRLPRDRAIAELLGAICYAAAAVVVLEKETGNE